MSRGQKVVAPRPEPKQLLPEISQVQRFTYAPGDRFIVRMNDDLYSQQECDDIARHFRQVMGLPDEVPVMVIDASVDIEIVRPA